MTGAHVTLHPCLVCGRRKGTGHMTSVGFDTPHEYEVCRLGVKRCSYCRAQWIGDTVIYSSEPTKITYRNNEAAKKAVAAAVRHEADKEEQGAAASLDDALRYRAFADRIEGLPRPTDPSERRVGEILKTLCELNTTAEGRAQLGQALPLLETVKAAVAVQKPATKRKATKTTPEG